MSFVEKLSSQKTKRTRIMVCLRLHPSLLQFLRQNPDVGFNSSNMIVLKQSWFICVYVYIICMYIVYLLHHDPYLRIMFLASWSGHLFPCRWMTPVPQFLFWHQARRCTSPSTTMTLASRTDQMQECWCCWFCCLRPCCFCWCNFSTSTSSSSSSSSCSCSSSCCCCCCRCRCCCCCCCCDNGLVVVWLL